MDRERLNSLFKDAGLGKKEFAKMLGISYVTVNGWGSTQGVPYWLESWLENYIKAKKFDELLEMARGMEGAHGR